MRQFLYSKTIETLIQFEYSAFEEATVPVCTFAFSNSHVNKKGCYLRLTEFRGGMEVQRQKTLEAIANHDCGYYYEQSADNFAKIPGSPVAYWWKDYVFNLFNGILLSDVAQPKVGLQTGENNKYLRYWSEIAWDNVAIGCRDRDEANKSNVRWFPCNKGGEFRRWYGNNFFVVDWEQDGYRIRNQKGAYIRNPQFYFKKGMTWSTISSGKLSMRYSPEGFIFETKGSVCFPMQEDHFNFILALLNTCVAQFLLQVLSPTLDYHEGPLGKIPAIVDTNIKYKTSVDSITAQNISMCKNDWDAYETSWDFQRNTLV
jgi:hypothetical protein